MVPVWKRATLLAAGWLLAAAATVAVAVAAIDTLGAGLIGQTGDDAPMSAADVQRRLADEPTAGPAESAEVSAEPTAPPRRASTAAPAPDHQGATSPRPSPTAPATGSSVTRTLDVQGGTVQARCSGGLATLIAWSPAPGFHVADATHGPAASLSITFTRNHVEIRTVITCVDGAPVARSVPHDD